jgi:hypothetical protein
MNPDSIVEYVKWLDARHNRLREAVRQHESDKTERALPGSIDEFDRTLWAELRKSHEGEE